MSFADLFGDNVIYAYTADQAVEDGYLIDVTEKSDGIFKIGCDMKWKVRISLNVHNLCTPPKSNKIQSYEGRLWDVLNLARWAIKRANEGDNMATFTCKIGRKNEQLWAMLDTTSGPAIHIITPEEN